MRVVLPAAEELSHKWRSKENIYPPWKLFTPVTNAPMLLVKEIWWTWGSNSCGRIWPTYGHDQTGEQSSPREHIDPIRIERLSNEPNLTNMNSRHESGKLNIHPGHPWSVVCTRREWPLLEPKHRKSCIRKLRTHCGWAQLSQQSRWHIQYKPGSWWTDDLWGKLDSRSL